MPHLSLLSYFTPKKMAIYILCSFVLGLLSLPVQAQKHDPVHQSVELTTLFSNRNTAQIACYRIPALTMAPNGDLLAVADQRIPSCADLNHNTDINLVLRRSPDGGKTWMPIETLVDYPLGQSASDASFVVDTALGTIWLFFNYMDHTQAPQVYHHKVMASHDNGKSWDNPQDITAQISKPEWTNDFKFITSGKGWQTKDGSLLHTLVHLNLGVFIFGSSDHGKSWFMLDRPLQPADESKIIELADGRWMVNSRVNNKGFRYVHVSSNKGVSWSTKADTALHDPGCNACLIRNTLSTSVEKNSLFIVNINHAKLRKGLTIRASSDNGETWSHPRTIYSGSAAYADACVLGTGDVGVLFEKDEYTDICFTTLPVEWIVGKSQKQD